VTDLASEKMSKAEISYSSQWWIYGDTNAALASDPLFEIP